MIPRMIADRLAPLMDQLQQLGLLLGTVAVDEKDRFGMMLVQRVQHRLQHIYIFRSVIER
ncbi:hypothetical protein D3C84_1239410 [compost metagenome]